MDEVKTMAAEDERLLAVLQCVTEPTEEQLQKFRAFLAKNYNKTSEEEVFIEVVKDASIGGGFILSIGNDQYDWSVRGRERQLERRIDAVRDEANRNGAQDNIMSMIRSAMDNFDVAAEMHAVGTVETVGDGIVTVTGLDQAMYGEIVLFDNGVKGMVQNITEDGIGVILFDAEGNIGEGSRVTCTGKKAGIPVSDGYLGRVVNALGEAIDDGAPIQAAGYRAIEQAAPGIVDRKPVTVPLQTGILAIDAMFPIGRGQRELIIGDRQTGKTSIAMDTILNQKGQNCICIYVAIGQKASTIANLYNELKQQGAMDYTIIVSSTASDPAPLQYIAPYSATSLGEYFMYNGQDVLIIYDDLSKHAVAYRTISLLLGRSPGREAYPGDVFYLHSRLLERSARLSDARGGGSMTALPIIETQDGDVSAYIPTNVISITDGQIFLESDLFFEGQRPAVNVGLSVSRVGGAAQTKAMKKSSGSLRIDLAQYREMQVFTQFAADLDDATKQQLQQGGVLMELLKQPLGRPLSMCEEVVTLCVAGNKKMVDIPVRDVKAFQLEMLSWFKDKHADIMQEITRSCKVEKDMEARILDCVDDFHKTWAEAHPVNDEQ